MLWGRFAAVTLWRLSMMRLFWKRIRVCLFLRYVNRWGGRRPGPKGSCFGRTGTNVNFIKRTDFFRADAYQSAYLLDAERQAVYLRTDDRGRDAAPDRAGGKASWELRDTMRKAITILHPMRHFPMSAGRNWQRSGRYLGCR